MDPSKWNSLSFEDVGFYHSVTLSAVVQVGLICTVLKFSSQFENNYFTEMCSGFEAGSYLRRIDFMYHSTLGSREIQKKDEVELYCIDFVVCWHLTPFAAPDEGSWRERWGLVFCMMRASGHSSSSSLLLLA